MLSTVILHMSAIIYIYAQLACRLKQYEYLRFCEYWMCNSPKFKLNLLILKMYKMNLYDLWKHCLDGVKLLLVWRSSFILKCCGLAEVDNWYFLTTKVWRRCWNFDNLAGGGVLATRYITPSMAISKSCIPPRRHYFMYIAQYTPYKILKQIQFCDKNDVYLGDPYSVFVKLYLTL